MPRVRHLLATTHQRAVPQRQPRYLRNGTQWHPLQPGHDVLPNILGIPIRPMLGPPGRVRGCMSGITPPLSSPGFAAMSRIIPFGTSPCQGCRSGDGENRHRPFPSLWKATVTVATLRIFELQPAFSTRRWSLRC